jgi:SHS2 domain-containing protein
MQRKRRQKRSEKVVFGVSSSESKPNSRRPKMNSTRTIETAISKGNLDDLLAAFLYQTSYAHDNEDIVAIKLGQENEHGQHKLAFTVKKRQQEVSLIKHNGGTT